MPSGETLLKALEIEKDVVSKSESGISWTSDRVTYPQELKGQARPDDVYPNSATALRISKEGAFSGLFSADDILFTLYGNFRPYDQLIENDPYSVVTPVMADVYVSYDSRWSGGKATMSKVDVRFNALDTLSPPQENPKIQFLCQGSYEPAGGGYIPFEFVFEVDAQANVSLVENRSSTDATLTDNSPQGVELTVSD